MDWLIRLQNVIEYIEQHLTDDQSILKLNTLAKQAYASEYEFQKIFSIVTGITAGEYIRNRKLASAGEEILMTDLSILNISLKYGYETAESFTKAFARFHGTTPYHVRKSGTGVKLYNKLSIHLHVEGGAALDYRIVNLGNVKVMAKTKIFKAKSVEERQRTIPEYLKKCGEEGLYEVLFRAKDDTTYFADAVLGIHDKVGCKPDGSEFRLSVGVEYRGDTAPEMYEIEQIPEEKWLVFRCCGMRPNAIQKLWHQIYMNFLPSSAYRIKEFGTLEVCREGFRNAEDVISELWLPLAHSTKG
jgi:AraC family transcriptional regulator